MDILPMTSILRDPAPDALHAAIAVNLWAYLRALGRSPQVMLHDAPTLRWFITGIPDPVYNGVIHVAVDPAAVDVTIQRVRQTFARHNAPLSWVVFPDSQPSDFAVQLAAHGFRRSATIHSMAASLAAPTTLSAGSPAGLGILPVHDATSWRDWIAVESGGFQSSAPVSRALARVRQGMGYADPADLTAERHFLAALHGEPVGTASLFLAAGIAGIYDVCVLPAARRQGVGAALTSVALAAAQTAGYHVAVLQPSDMGRGVYARLGFQDAPATAVYA